MNQPAPPPVPQPPPAPPRLAGLPMRSWIYVGLAVIFGGQSIRYLFPGLSYGQWQATPWYVVSQVVLWVGLAAFPVVAVAAWRWRRALPPEQRALLHGRRSLRTFLLVKWAIIAAGIVGFTVWILTSSASPRNSVIRLRLVATPEGASQVGAANFGFKVLELRADGGMLRDGQVYGLIGSDRVLDAGGATLFMVAPDGTLTSHNADHDEFAKLTSEGTVTGGSGGRLTIAGDGTITFTRADGTTVPVPGRFDAVPSGEARAACLMLATTRPGLALWGRQRVP